VSLLAFTIWGSKLGEKKLADRRTGSDMLMVSASVKKADGSRLIYDLMVEVEPNNLV
jgi:hypothetical protein